MSLLASTPERDHDTKYDGEKPTSPPSKTPISSLQEWCQRLGKTPQYDLTAMEGRAHQPQFVYRCTVGDITRTGQGGSKKAAKHTAAESVLNVLKSGGSTEDDEETNQFEEVEAAPQETVPIQNDTNNSNPVGTLQELVVARGWRLPVYVLHTESGPAHKKEFIMCCTVESFNEYGSGTAKKHAKRTAATKMYNRIMSLPPDAEPRIDVETKPKTVAFDVLHNAAGDRIQPMALENLLNINVCQSLQKVAECTNFSVEYYDVTDDFPTQGIYQCMAMLTTQPALVVHGEGPSCDEAHVAAARNALKLLNIFFRRSASKVDVKQEASCN